MVSALKEAKMFEEAAVVLRDYLDDAEEAIASLVEGSRWAEADRLIMRENRVDLRGEQVGCNFSRSLRDAVSVISITRAPASSIFSNISITHSAQWGGTCSVSETHLLPALTDAAEAALSNLRKQRRTFDEQMERLRSVVETRRKIACGLYDEGGGGDGNVEDADLYSDATSLAPSATAAPKSNPASLRTRFATPRRD